MPCPFPIPPRSSFLLVPAQKRHPRPLIFRSENRWFLGWQRFRRLRESDCGRAARPPVWMVQPARGSKEAVMSVQIGQATTTGSRRDLKKQVVAAACGLGVTVATLVGIGAWQASAHVRAGGVGYAPTGSVQQAVRPPSALFARGGGGTVYFLTGSQEQADSV